MPATIRIHYNTVPWLVSQRITTGILPLSLVRTMTQTLVEMTIGHVWVKEQLLFV